MFLLGVILVRIFPDSDWIIPNTATFYTVEITKTHMQTQKKVFKKILKDTKCSTHLQEKHG